MSSNNLVQLIVAAESEFDSGSLKKAWVLNHLSATGLDKPDASVLIDDIVSLMNSYEARKLFRDGSSMCMSWWCR